MMPLDRIAISAPCRSVSLQSPFILAHCNCLLIEAMLASPKGVLPQDPLGALGSADRLFSGRRVAGESMCASPMAAAESQLAGQLVEVQAKMQLQQWQEAEAQADPVSSCLPCSSTLCWPSRAASQ